MIFQFMPLHHTALPKNLWANRTYDEHYEPDRQTTQNSTKKQK